jgi:hypothetical protein
MTRNVSYKDGTDNDKLIHFYTKMEELRVTTELPYSCLHLHDSNEHEVSHGLPTLLNPLSQRGMTSC